MKTTELAAPSRSCPFTLCQAQKARHSVRHGVFALVAAGSWGAALLSSALAADPASPVALQDVKARLESKPVQELYSKTYYSLLDRIAPDGYFEESLTGAYGGMYCRTAGATVALFIEAGELQNAENTIRFILDATRRNGKDRIAHILGKAVQGPDGKVSQQYTGNESQIDGQAHVILAWAQLALARGTTPFEDETYEAVAKLMDSTVDWPYFLSGEGQLPMFPNHQMHLIYSVSLEHSREGRRWQCFDILTNSFTGAALESMIAVAKRRGDEARAKVWEGKLADLRKGIETNLTRVVNGKKVFLEMRLPDGNKGVPFEGMSWVNYGPVAAQWDPLGREVTTNTIDLLREKLWRRDLQDGKLHYLALEYAPNGSLTEWIIGKGVAWDLDYSRKEKQWDRIAETLDFLALRHDRPVYMESMGYDAATKKWVVSQDIGNGEQAAWWCWAMARLRKEAGLPVVPPRVP